MTPIQRIRVPAGFLFTALFLYLAHPTAARMAAGLALAAVGLAVRVWAAGHLRKWSGLAVGGPYRWTRNPLYLGSFVMGTGFGIASGRPGLLAAFLVLFALVYLPVMRREEGELVEAYGGEFEEYRRRVPLFVPIPGRSLPQARGGNFTWERVVYNREYQAVAGFLLLAAALVAKMSWF